MWIIISTAIPIVLSIYGLARLQQNRNSHGAQGPSGGVYQRLADSSIPGQLYNHEKPHLSSPDFPAITLQSAEEKDAVARKYLVKWDSDEESEQSSALPLPVDVVAVGASSVEEPKRTHKHKSKQAEVKWDAFEEE